MSLVFSFLGQYILERVMLIAIGYLVRKLKMVWQ